MSLLIIPISFGLFSTIVTKIEARQFNIFSIIFVASTIAYCLVVLFTIVHLEYFTGKVTINEVYNIATNTLFGIEQHPIYASILISIAIFLSVFKLIKTSNIYGKGMLIIGNTILLFTLFFFSRKAIILALAFAFIVFAIINFKKLKIKKILLISTLIFVAALVSTPVLKKRFKEVFYTVTYSKISPDNSSSIRFGVYKCVLKTIQKHPIIGYGVGDVDVALQECYAKTSKILVEGNYNSHNQYLGIALSNGVFGLLFLILFLFYNVKKAIQHRDKFFLAIVLFYIVTMFFENILERQSGVIIFAFYICFFNFIKIEKINSPALEKEDNHYRS